MENLDEFVDKLIAEKGFSEKDPDVLEQIKLDLIDRLEDRVNAMVLERLPASCLEDFQELLDSGTPEAIQEFVTGYIPDIKERTAFELMTFKTMYLS